MMHHEEVGVQGCGALEAAEARVHDGRARGGNWIRSGSRLPTMATVALTWSSASLAPQVLMSVS